MQKIILPLLLFFACLTACGQQSHVDRFYEKHNGEGSISVDPGLMLNASFSGSDNGNWMHKLTNVRMLIIDGKKASGVQEWDELSRSVQSDDYEDLATIRKAGKGGVRLLSRDVKDGMKDIVFLASGDEGGGLFLQFRGHFTQADIDKMMSSVDSDSH